MQGLQEMLSQLLGSEVFFQEEIHVWGQFLCQLKKMLMVWTQLVSQGHKEQQQESEVWINFRQENAPILLSLMS